MLAFRDFHIEVQAPAPEEEIADLRWQDPATPLSISELRSPEGLAYRLRLDRDLAVDVWPDERIVVRQAAQVPKATIDHFLADQVIPRLIAHRGSFVFHAGAVRSGDGALVFLGQSGRGKSTLVASFDQAGAGLIGDDAMVLSMVDGAPHISPVYRSLRLFPDSIGAVIPGASTAGPVAHYTTKERIDVEVASDELAAALPIRTLFSLGAAVAGDEIRCRRMSVAETCMILVESAFALDPADLARAMARLESASVLASNVPCFEVSYPRDYARLPELRAAIIAQAQDRV